MNKDTIHVLQGVLAAKEKCRVLQKFIVGGESPNSLLDRKWRAGWGLGISRNNLTSSSSLVYDFV